MARPQVHLMGFRLGSPQIKKVASFHPKYNPILYMISNFRAFYEQVFYPFFVPPPHEYFTFAPIRAVISGPAKNKNKPYSQKNQGKSHTSETHIRGTQFTQFT